MLGLVQKKKYEEAQEEVRKSNAKVEDLKIEIQSLKKKNHHMTLSYSTSLADVRRENALLADEIEDLRLEKENLNVQLKKSNYIKSEVSRLLGKVNKVKSIRIKKKIIKESKVTV